MEKRIHYLDVAKGVGILLVIAEHCLSINGNNNITSFLLSFHMPFFFVVGGVLYREQSNSEFIINKINSLLIPTLFCYIINLFIRVIISGMSIPYSQYIVDVLQFRGTWFIFSMFCVSIGYNILHRLIKAHTLRLFVIFIIMFMGAYLAYNKYSFINDCAIHFMMSIFFYMCGDYFGRYLIGMICQKKMASIVSSIILLICCSTLSINKTFQMYNNKYDSISIFVFNSIVCSFSILILCYHIKNFPVIEIFGKNSLHIMLSHFPIYLLPFYISAYFGVKEVLTSFPINVLYICTVSIASFFFSVFLKKIPFLSGEKLIT